MARDHHSQGPVDFQPHKIADQIGLTIRQIRVAEDKLIKSGSIVVKGANKYSVYSIVKYDEYQTIELNAANKGQTKGNRAANKGQQLNNDNNENNENKTVPPTPLPEWMPMQLWADYLEMRKVKKASPTEKAIMLLIAKLDGWRAKGHDPSEILSKSITSNWTDIFEPKGKQHGTHTGSRAIRTG